jgi:hypothetical protein
MPQVYCDKDLPSFFNKANLPAHIKEIPLNHLHDTDEEEMKSKVLPKIRRTKNHTLGEEELAKASKVNVQNVSTIPGLESAVAETAEWL